ncbi:LysR family transcriptional regulator [Mesosutterella sp. AGMB02718]|uniref:LysR family transcriptional regulator n=1 Tax=Mesosutterella faecium TaxID=2925194 RepID=A0ABT7IJF0_9BURK|nr:LysR family transcriptional regulator [Mesosutterella sp. AGMB02718]MDL2058492.1 LysR family transcriptional regulator [Mesosutterella sp. AGMB02718]
MAVDITDNLLVWKVIDAVSRTGSLTGAAIELGLELPHVSRLVSQLESAMGVSMLERTSKPVRLSEFADKQLPLIRRMIRISEQIEREAECCRHANPSVRIRFGLATVLLARHVLEMLRSYEAGHPGTRVEVKPDNSLDSLFKGKADIVYLYGHADNPLLYELPCVRCANCLVATPAYLKRRGTPLRVEDLARHTLLLSQRSDVPATSRLICGSEEFSLDSLEHWVFDPRSGRRELIGRAGGPGPEKRSSDEYVSYAAVMNDQGIAVDIPLSFLEPRLKAGLLVPVLPGWHRPV